MKLPFPDPELPAPLPRPLLPPALLSPLPPPLAGGGAVPPPPGVAPVEIPPPPGGPWGALVSRASALPTVLSTRLYELTEPAEGNVTVSWVHPALSVFWAVPDPGSTQAQDVRSPF